MILYDIAFIIFSILYIPFSIYKKGFRALNIRQRLGFISAQTAAKLNRPDNVWIHAVSVGEVMVLAPFLEQFKCRFSRYSIVLSVTTKTGYELAKKTVKEDVVVIYSPFDLSFAVERFINLIGPKIFIVIETEIWPNLLGILNNHNVPIVLINGRISPRSFGRYCRAKLLLKSILEKIDLFCMQSEADASRIIHLGAPAEKVKNTGNMKLDSEPRTPNPEPRNVLGLSDNDILLVAGSTHKGEEEILFDAYKNLRKEFSNLRLLIAPRHINRVEQIERLAKSKGFLPFRVSGIGYRDSKIFPNPENVVFLLDTIGQLKDFYSIADIVFIGGSLVPHGGQNPVEPAYFSKPVIFGSYMFNFQEISQNLLKNGGAIDINVGAIHACPGEMSRQARELPLQITAVLSSLIRDPKKRLDMGITARQTIETGKGATQRNLDLICKWL